MMQISETENEKIIHREVTKRMNWIHCNVMIINELIQNGILMPVNTNYSGKDNLNSHIVIICYSNIYIY